MRRPGGPRSWRIAVLREPARPRWLRVRARAAGRGRQRSGSAARATTSPWLPAPRYLFVAGGIGITPILPMLAAAEAAGADWTLLYGGRTRASMAFLDRIAPYADKVERSGSLLPVRSRRGWRAFQRG